mmetsp:Transcript_13235/g.44238  ORF Transcript_13235/g.44238 Transcript_13235/m.44238 type:complete len:342 (-) Transcript_13235:44-1069(-)
MEVTPPAAPLFFIIDSSSSAGASAAAVMAAIGAPEWRFAGDGASAAAPLASKTSRRTPTDPSLGQSSDARKKGGAALENGSAKPAKNSPILRKASTRRCVVGRSACCQTSTAWLCASTTSKGAAWSAKRSFRARDSTRPKAQAVSRLERRTSFGDKAPCATAALCAALLVVYKGPSTKRRQYACSSRRIWGGPWNMVSKVSTAAKVSQSAAQRRQRFKCQGSSSARLRDGGARPKCAASRACHRSAPVAASSVGLSPAPARRTRGPPSMYRLSTTALKASDSSGSTRTRETVSCSTPRASSIIGSSFASSGRKDRSSGAASVRKAYSSSLCAAAGGGAPSR